jgi:hypothetical protein
MAIAKTELDQAGQNFLCIINNSLNSIKLNKPSTICSDPFIPLSVYGYCKNTWLSGNPEFESSIDSPIYTIKLSESSKKSPNPFIPLFIYDY